MGKKELIDLIKEQVKDSINVIQLLETMLETSGEDPYIRRSVGIVEKILQVMMESVDQLGTVLISETISG